MQKFGTINTMEKNQLNGIILLNKPSGISSNFALQRVKKILNAEKAGYMGTLDPFATGLLLCCVGYTTKISELILQMRKTYQAIVQFGKETDSGDLTGNVIACSCFRSIDKRKLKDTISCFLGKIQQVPPMYSALKKNGKPLYFYARQGIELERAPREVNIHEIKILHCSSMKAELEVTCGRGTYVRVLAQDIGRSMGCFGYLSHLKRIQIGPFFLKDAVDLEFLENAKDPRRFLVHTNMDQLSKSLTLF